MKGSRYLIRGLPEFTGSERDWLRLTGLTLQKIADTFSIDTNVSGLLAVCSK